MTNYIPLQHALRQIPKSLFKEAEEVDFLSDMLNALKELPSISRTESKISIFEIIDGKVSLPKELKYINLVSYLSSNPDQNSLNSLLSCIENPEAEETWYNNTESICRYAINYKMFLDSAYYNNNFAPLKYVGNSTDIVKKDSPNRFLHSGINTYTVDKSKCLHSSITDGFLAIDYDIDLRNENGDFLIPDYPEVVQYLAKYAIMKHWEDRQNSKEEQANALYQKYQQETEIYFRKAKGEILLRNADLNTIANVVNNSYSNLIKIPEKFIYAR
jgi:hypothetical protein